MRGRRRLASSTFPLRYARSPVAAAAAGRCAPTSSTPPPRMQLAAASSAARTPLAVKLVSDPAYERAHRYGLFDGTLEEFQRPAGPEGRGSQAPPHHVLWPARRDRRARAPTWRGSRSPGVSTARRVTVLPNPAPALDVTAADGSRHVRVRRPAHAPEGPRHRDRRSRRGAGGAVDRRGRRPRPERLEALARAWHVSTGGSRFAGSLPAHEALAVVAGADAALITSAWENFPHSAVEALAVGVPVVATAVGGVPEIVHDGENGLLVPVGRSTSSRGRCDVMLENRTSGTAGRAARGLRWRACRSPASTASWSRSSAGSLVPEEKPRVLFVGRGRYRLPLSDARRRSGTRSSR